MNFYLEYSSFFFYFNREDFAFANKFVSIQKRRFCNIKIPLTMSCKRQIVFFKQIRKHQSDDLNSPWFHRNYMLFQSHRNPSHRMQTVYHLSCDDSRFYALIPSSSHNDCNDTPSQRRIVNSWSLLQRLKKCSKRQLKINRVLYRGSDGRSQKTLSLRIPILHFIRRLFFEAGDSRTVSWSPDCQPSGTINGKEPRDDARANGWARSSAYLLRTRIRNGSLSTAGLPTVSGVTILLSLTVFLNLVAETLPQVSDAIPLLGTLSSCK